MNIIVDLESIGATDPAIIERIAANIKPPGNIKKQESLDKWHLDDKPAAIEEALLKTSFDGTYGQIVCIGFSIDDRPVQTFCGPDERYLVTSLYQALQDAVNEAKHAPVTFVGHNLVGFDLKFLWKRSIILGIKPPKFIPFKAKPWDAVVFDTMQEWDSDKDKRISLDNLCAVLGIESPKGEMDGSKVWDAFKAGEYDKIATYCAGDVDATRKAHQRMTFA